MELSDKKFEIVGCEDLEANAIVRPNVTYWQDAWRRLKKNKVAVVSLIGLVVIILMCIFGPYISGFPYNKQFIDLCNNTPSKTRWFGTDELGRDIFSRVWMGGRVSIAIGLIGTFIEVVIGSLYGGIAGYLGGKVDNVMMRIVEIIVGIPYLIVVILVSVVLGPGLGTLIIALCITGWVGIARLIRGQVMQLKQSEYVIAAKLLGTSPLKIILRHMIPNTIGVMIVYISFDIPGFIFAEAFLSFIGLGVQPPMTSWGAMASLGMSKIDQYPHELIFPVLAISLTMLSFNLLGDGLRDALDPKLRQ